ncbi:MAG: CcdB family protein [Rhodocyclaceae bacterium]|jgi:toxin CcdB|nr:CcdB family protein [Rhodocyclaceae bacterium]
MAQFDVFHNPDRASAARIPFLVTLQSDLLDPIENHIVAPLRIAEDDSVIPVLRLNPLVFIDGQRFHLRVQDLAAVPRRLLKAPVANLSNQREEILAAIDFLFTGF